MTFRDWRAFTGALIVGLLIILVPAVNAWAKAIGTPTIRSYQQWQKTTGPVITGGAPAQSNQKRPEKPGPTCAGNGYSLVSITSTYAVAAEGQSKWAL